MLIFTLFGFLLCVPNVKADFNDKKLSYDVKIGSHPGYVHFPGDKIVDAQFPWVWYAPFNGGTPSRNDLYLFERLAEAGIAIAYVDNHDSRGDQAGIDVFNQFYARLMDFDIGCDFFTYEIKALENLVRPWCRFPALFKTSDGKFYVVKDEKAPVIEVKKNSDLFAKTVSEIGFPGGSAAIILNRKACRLLNESLPPGHSGHGPKLTKKVCLLGGSRGGLMHYSWAFKNADRIAAIAGFYPVLDPRLWPGPAEMAKVYHMSETDYLAFYEKHTLISKIHILAEKKIPILHLHGNNDTTVPYKSEREFGAEYLRAGGEFSLITSWGNGHDDSMEVFASQELLDFLIYQSAKNKLDEAMQRK